ncbi:MAG: hypothetical protein QN173_04235 [Armatimonadota bacterium]|nr:hypothetical protein [Armatimonadota bacterium]MDR7402227.1 hypothetical protein [Armatimonadota bacterium]MDR7403355.1 hypothetical protein [Armatimonadota bacterium]MDR7436983.1 hypothetical protein [Armatimonadota bacterium]MDR7506798.1 hypothetical protein [Armatimonadota bacterium]
MHPVGIALAFLVFWSLVAAGAFLCTACLRRLVRWQQALAGSGRVALTEGVGVVLHLVGLATGATLVAAGLYATYVVLMAR